MRSLISIAILSAIPVVPLTPVLAFQTLHPSSSTKDVSWLNEIQTPPDSAADEPADLTPLLIDPVTGNFSESVESWQRQRAVIRLQWQEFLQPLEPPAKLPEMTEIESESIGEVTRIRIAYDSGDQWPTEAYLLKPKNIQGKVPGVAVFHSTVDHSIRQPAGVEGRSQLAFGLKLAQLGYVVICPRNYLWPDNDKIQANEQADRFHQQHPDSKGMAKMLFDAQLAVDILTSQSEVDATRIGAIGHSLGAKEVLYLAAFDERIKMTISSEGGIGTRFSNWDAPWYLGSSIQREDFRHEHHELLAMIAPRPFLLIGGDSADGDKSWPFIAAALPVYQLYADPAPLGVFNHKQGHAVPAEAEKRIYEWIETYLPL
jgi:hypothetical protein